MEKKLERQFEIKMYEILRADGPLSNSKYCKKVLDDLNKIQEQLVKKVKKLPDYKNKGIEIEEKVSVDDFNRKLRELYNTKRKVKWLKRHPEEWGFGKDVWYYCPGQEHLLELKLGMSLLKIPYESREHHTQDIKREVILPWIEQLPSDMNAQKLPFGTSFNYSNPMKGKHNLGEDLSVEKNLLFLDFKNHIKPQLGNPIENLEDFKKQAKQYREKEDEILHNIETDIKKHLGMKIKNDHIPDWMTCLVYKILFEEYEKDSMKKQLYIKPSYFKSQVKFEEGKIVVYSLMPPLQEIFLIKKRIALSESRKEILKKLEMAVSIDKLAEKPDKTHEEEILISMDKKIMELPEKIDKISNLRDEIKDLIKIKKDMIRTIDKIETSLKKYKDLPIFPGKCEYLSSF